MKLCWGLLTQPSALWVRCLKSKYDCGNGDRPRVSQKRYQSAVWRAIVSVWDKFCEGLGWKVRNGHHTSVWNDRWANVELPLKSYVSQNHLLLNLEERVSDFLTASGEWNVAKWLLFLPHPIVDRITNSSPPSQSGADVFTWRHSQDGTFSVKSAYNWIMSQKNPLQPVWWQSIWRWNIPKKAIYFLWQVFQERVPVISFIAKFIHNISPECPFECDSEETLLHMLRDCEKARHVWCLLINPLYHSIFFNGSLQD